jgi:hypothetical protein
MFKYLFGCFCTLNCTIKYCEKSLYFEKKKLKKKTKKNKIKKNKIKKNKMKKKQNEKQNEKNIN